MYFCKSNDLFFFIRRNRTVPFVYGRMETYGLKAIQFFLPYQNSKYLILILIVFDIFLILLYIHVYKAVGTRNEVFGEYTKIRVPMDVKKQERNNEIVLYSMLVLGLS